MRAKYLQQNQYKSVHLWHNIINKKMKQLKTDITGKFPFVLDDLRWQFQGIKEAIAQLCKPYGDKVILWGLEVSGISLSPGAVFINDEIYTFAGVEPLYPPYVLKITTANNEEGLKEFPDRAEGDKLQNTYLDKYVSIRTYGGLPDPLPADEFLISEFVRLDSLNDNSEIVNGLAAEIQALKTKVNETDYQEVTLPIGVWVIGTDGSKEVDFSSLASDYERYNFANNIRAFEVILQDDYNNIYDGLSKLEKAGIEMQYDNLNNKVVFTNTNPGGWSDFTNDAINRGYVTIRYKLQYEPMQ